MIIWGLGQNHYVLTDIPMDSCKLAPLQFSGMDFSAVPLRRGKVTFNLRALNSRFCLIIFF